MENLWIRTIKESDAEAFLSLCTALDQETSFMMLELDERITTVDEQRARIREIQNSRNSTILIAEQSGTLIGYVGAFGESFRRCRHSAYVVCGILASHHGKGIGTMLFRELEEWAKSSRIRRLELTVMVHNEAGIALYKKSGFEIEGTKRHSLIIGDQFIDEFYMAKLL